MDPLLRRAVILDTETLGTHRGAGIHETAIYDFETNQVREWILNPNRIQIKSRTTQDVSLHRTHPLDEHVRQNLATWRAAILEDYYTAGGKETELSKITDDLRWQNKFLIDALESGKYPHLQGKPLNPRQILGTTLLTETGVDPTKLFTQDILPHLQGRTIWIANARFESSIIGAQLAADNASEKFKRDLKLETFRPDTPDPFYITGKEVNTARAIAQTTGDWRGVWQAYKTYTPKAGETAVRDIQDVIRSMYAYGKSTGLLSAPTGYYGTGIDVTHQLFSLAEEDTQRIGMKEFHKAAEDAAIHEKYVLKKSIEYTRALEEFEAGTPVGEQMRQQALKGEGPLARITRYFSLLEQAGPDLQRVNFLSRIHKAYEDIYRQGVTAQSSNRPSSFSKLQETANGLEPVPQTWTRTQEFRNLDDVFHFIKKTGDYSGFGLDLDAEYKNFIDAATNRQSAAEYIIEQQSKVQDITKMIPSIERLQRVRLPGTLEDLSNAFFKDVASNPKAILMGAGVIAALGAVTSFFHKEPKPKSTLLAYTYEDWLANQEGMGRGPISKMNRHTNTDFGSPYRGPVVSSQVLIEQDLLLEREKYIRAQYGASTHSGFKIPYSLPGGGYSYLPGEAVPSGYRGIKGKDLVRLDLTNFDVRAEDADTIKIRRKGFLAQISSFLGAKNEYSIRLAGLDAPELEHPGSYRGAQPFANQAKDAVQQILENAQNKEIVFQSSNTSYGRMLGVAFSDTKNLNYQIVQEGLATHLPYGKRENAIIDYAKLKRLEGQAYRAEKGFWGEPFARVFYAATQGNERPTLNTLAKASSIAENASYMSLVSAMQQRQLNPNIIQSVTDILYSGDDNVRPGTFELSQIDLLNDNASYIRTKGTGDEQNRLDHRTGLSDLNLYLAVDGMHTTNSVWTRKRYKAFDDYDVAASRREARRQEMQFAQQRINQMMFQSPINHHRMP